MRVSNIPINCSTSGDHSYLFGAVCELHIRMGSYMYGLKSVSKMLHSLGWTLEWLLTQ